jgi:hypothetical protein
MAGGSDAAVTRWLLAGDCAIRWQVLRDLLGAREEVWRAEQRRVATSGWGLRLLGRQRDDGNWGRGPYRPKWTCTTYTMQLLWQMGLEPRHPAAVAAGRRCLEEGLGDDGGINFWRPGRKIGETCVTGMILGQLGHFRVDDRRVDRILGYLLGEQMPDGGWNCRRPDGAVHSSFHTTISVLEGLREHVPRDGGRSRAAEEAAVRAREFLLAHRLFRSHRTGRTVAGEMTRFHFPPHWHYDVLRGLDYFRSVGAPRDARLRDAIRLLESRRAAGGRWLLPRGYPGAVHFAMEAPGAPSRWNTLRALRVLAWWASASRTS